MILEPGRAARNARRCVYEGGAEAGKLAFWLVWHFCISKRIQRARERHRPETQYVHLTQ